MRKFCIITFEINHLCFFAGANSIFYGEKLLTPNNPKEDKDLNLLRKLDIRVQKYES